MTFNSKFEALQEETERILNSSSREEIYQSVIKSIHKLLDTRNTKLFLYSRRNESLTTLSTIITNQKDSIGGDESGFIDKETINRGELFLWDTYIEKECKLLKSSNNVSDIVSDEYDQDTAITLPLGPYGVLFILEAEHITFTEIDLSVGEFISSAVTRALDSERRERGLEMVQAVSRDSMTAETYEEMAKLILQQLPEVLDYPLCAIWKYNEITHQLEPIGTTGPAKTLIPDHPVFQPGNSIAWDVFEQDETRVISDTTTHPETYNPDSPIKSEVITSIGEFGVFAAGATRPGSFNSTEKQIISSLSTNLQTIVRLVDRHGEFQLLDDVLGRVIRHNIRNELTVIKGNANIVHQPDIDSKRYDESYSELIDACERLEKTAENAQLMRNVVQNRSEKVKLTIVDAVEAVVNNIKSEYPDAKIEFKKECSQNCTEMHLHQNFDDAIRELMVNSVRHMNSKSKPEIDVGVSESPDVLRISISDNGPGIPDDELSVLDGNEETRLDHGSGAGLWAVDRIISHSGGRLKFDIGHGTTANIELPKKSL